LSQPSLDVLGIGNAIVDVIAKTDEAFLKTHGLAKAAMTLIDAERAESLYGVMADGIEASGGSAANSMAGLASLGGRAGFIGKVRDDQLGGIFAHDIRAAGVQFQTPAASSGLPTARCLIFVTDDAQRTMQTFLGASTDLGPADVDEAMIASASVTYLEGYLWDKPQAKEAFLRAAAAAHKAGRKVSLTLSDAFCVDRHRADFKRLVKDHVDILFANEAEILSLYETTNFDDAVAKVRGDCDIAALTRSEKGAVIVAGDKIHAVAAEPIAKLVDTTGAGDLYAAGFLYGYTRALPLPVCGRIGAIAAAEIIGHYGARPEVKLADLVKAKLGPLTAA
jgi:sugar/nucleoside kinase (ribokinase family)